MSRMTWRALWKVSIELPCAAKLNSNIPAIGLRGPVYGVIQNVRTPGEQIGTR
jgi:hypothetical protein